MLSPPVRFSALFFCPPRTLLRNATYAAGRTVGKGVSRNGKTWGCRVRMVKAGGRCAIRRDQAGATPST